MVTEDSDGSLKSKSEEKRKEGGRQLRELCSGEERKMAACTKLMVIRGGKDKIKIVFVFFQQQRQQESPAGLDCESKRKKITWENL